MTNRAAGSAIKGINVVSAAPVKSPVPPVSGKSTAAFAASPVSPVVEQHPAPLQTGFEPHVTAKMPGVAGFAAGARLHRSPIALSVFTISRDQRLSRWDLMEEDNSLLTSVSETPIIVTGTNDRQYSDSRTRGDDADSSSSLGLGGEGNRGTRNADAAVAACDELRAVLSQQGGDGLRQRTRQEEKKEEQRRWRLRWRAGCVTDVCDISGLDVVPLIDDSPQEEAMGDQSSDHLSCSPSDTALEEGEGTTVKLNEQGAGEEEASASPAALVAVSGQGLQLVIFGAC